jgi:hypothetical protein
MKADQYGTPSEKQRFALGWRTTEKGEERCDACQYSHIGLLGSEQKPIRCLLANVSTRAAATCEKPAEFVRIYEMRQAAEWRPAWEDGGPNPPRCKKCDFIGDNGNGPAPIVSISTCRPPRRTSATTLRCLRLWTR